MYSARTGASKNDHEIGSLSAVSNGSGRGLSVGAMSDDASVAGVPSVLRETSCEKQPQ